MNYPLAVGGLQRLTSLQKQTPSLDRRGYALGQPGRQGLAFQQLHHEIVAPVGKLAERKDVDYVRMTNLVDRPGLVGEPLEQGGIAGKEDVKHLDGDTFADDWVARGIDHAHPAAADLALDSVLADERSGRQSLVLADWCGRRGEAILLRDGHDSAVYLILRFSPREIPDSQLSQDRRHIAGELAVGGRTRRSLWLVPGGGVANLGRPSPDGRLSQTHEQARASHYESDEKREQRSFGLQSQCQSKVGGRPAAAIAAASIERHPALAKGRPEKLRERLGIFVGGHCVRADRNHR